MQKTSKFVRNPTEPVVGEEKRPDSKKTNPSKVTVTTAEPAIVSKADPVVSPADPVVTMSQEEKMKKYNETLLKDAVPNCPICGKILTSHSVIILISYIHSSLNM
jgi:hypothetical protein